MPKVSTSYKPGQSGNPKGRPKKEWTWSGVLKEIAEREDKTNKKEYKTLAGEALFKEVLKGNVPAIKEFGDRIDGKAKQSHELTGKDGEPFVPTPIYGGKSTE